jgi:hypothetical protein
MTGPKAWPLNYCFAATAFCVQLALRRPATVVERHDNRPYADFTEFWPLYVSQHSQPLTKLLQAVGTSSILFSRMPWAGGRELSLRFCLGITAALSLTLCTVDWTAHFATGGPEAIVMILLLVGTVRKFTGLPVKRILARLASGYIIPWAAHYLVEHTWPATFLHPVFSLIGDFKLMLSIMTGQLALDASRA